MTRPLDEADVLVQNLAPGAAARLGQHTEALLDELGWPKEAIARLREAGAI